MAIEELVQQTGSNYFSINLCERTCMMPGHKGAKVGEGKPRVRTALRSRTRHTDTTKGKKNKGAVGAGKPTGSLEFHLVGAPGNLPSKKRLEGRIVFDDPDLVLLSKNRLQGRFVLVRAPVRGKTTKSGTRRYKSGKFILESVGGKGFLEEALTRERDLVGAAGAASSVKRPEASSPPIGSPGGNLLSAAVANETIDAEALGEALGLSKGQLAAMMGLPSDALYRQQRAQADKTQNRLRELIEILMRVEPWAGGRLQALAWYRGQSIPALGDQTAESLVKTGGADILRSYLDGIAAGGYA